jgi:multidrug efflux pump subunit AcrB
MLASYGFSRTLTPITIGLLLKGEQHDRENWFDRLYARFNRGFESMRSTYTNILRTLLERRIIVPAAAAIVLALGVILFMFVGRDFFPVIDGGQIQLHVRVPAGTRIEKTEQVFQAIENKIRDVIPESERDLILDNIGLPARSYNYAFGDGTATGLNDGVILVALMAFFCPTKTTSCLPRVTPV